MSVDAWLNHVCRVVNRNLLLTEWRQVMGPDRAYESTCPDLPPGDGVTADAS